MLITPTLDKLQALHLRGHGRAPSPSSWSAPTTPALTFEERLGLLVDREMDRPREPPPRPHLKAARLRSDACIEDLDFRAPAASTARPGAEPGRGPLGDRASQRALITGRPAWARRSSPARSPMPPSAGATAPSTCACRACSTSSCSPGPTAACRGSWPPGPRSTSWSSTTSALRR